MTLTEERVVILKYRWGTSGEGTSNWLVTQLGVETDGGSWTELKDARSISGQTGYIELQGTHMGSYSPGSHVFSLKFRGDAGTTATSFLLNSVSSDWTGVSLHAVVI